MTYWLTRLCFKVIIVTISSISFFILPKTFAGVLDKLDDKSSSVMPATASIGHAPFSTVSPKVSVSLPSFERAVVPIYDSNGRRIGLITYISYYDSDGRLIRSRYSKNARYAAGNLVEESDKTWKYNKLGQAIGNNTISSRKGVDEKGNEVDSYFKKQETNQWNKEGLLVYKKTEEIGRDGDTDLTQMTEEKFGYNDKGLVTSRSKYSKIEGITKNGDIADETTTETETKQYNSEGKVVKEKITQTRQTNLSDITEEITKSYIYNAEGLVGTENYTKNASGISGGTMLDESVSGVKTNQYDVKDRLVKQDAYETKRTGTDITVQNSVKTLAYDVQGNISNINSTINQTGTKEGEQVNSISNIEMSAQAFAPEAFKKAIEEFLASANVSGIENKFIANITTENKITNKTTTVLQGIEQGSLMADGIESGIVRLELNYEGKNVDKGSLKEVFTYNYEESSTGQKLLKHKDKYNASGVYQGLEGYKYDNKDRLTIVYDEDVQGNQTVKFANKYDANGSRKTFSADGYVYLYNSSDQLKAVITPDQDVYLMGSNGKVDVVVTATGEAYKINEAGQVQYMFNGSTLVAFENGSVGQDTGEVLESQFSYDGYGYKITRATGKFYTNINGNQATENLYAIYHRLGGFGVSSWWENRSTGTVTLSEEAAALVAGYAEFIKQGAEVKDGALGTSSALLAGGVGYQVGSLMNINASHHRGNTYIAYYDGWWYGVRESLGSSQFTLAPGQTLQDGIDNMLVQQLAGYVQNSSGKTFDKSKDYLVLSTDEATRLGEKLTAAGIKYIVKDTSVAAVEKSPESLYLYAQQGPREAYQGLSGWISKPRPPLRYDGMTKNGDLIIIDYDSKKKDGSVDIKIIGASEVFASGRDLADSVFKGEPTFGIASGTISSEGKFTLKEGNNLFTNNPKLLETGTSFTVNLTKALHETVKVGEDGKDVYEIIKVDIGPEAFVKYDEISMSGSILVSNADGTTKVVGSVSNIRPPIDYEAFKRIKENIKSDGSFQSQSRLFANNKELIESGTVFKFVDGPDEFLRVTVGAGVFNNSLEAMEQKKIQSLNEMIIK